MSKDEQISFQVEIPEDSDIEHIMYRIQDVANSVVYDSDKETITGIVSEENKLQLIRYLRSEALQHNLELKKTFWLKEDLHDGMKLRPEPIGAVAFAILLSVIGLKAVTTALLDYWWFQSLAFEQVFLKNLTTGVGIFVAVFFALEILWYLNWKIIQAKQSTEDLANTKGAYFLVLSVISMFFAYSISKACWLKWLTYSNQVPFNTVDPVFGLDIGFYVFTLPLAETALFWLFIIVITLLITNFIGKILTEDASPEDFEDLEKINPFGWKIILPVIVFATAGNFWLKRYELLFSESQVIAGPGYTDIHIWLPTYGIMAVVMVLLGIAILLKPVLNKTDDNSQNTFKFASNIGIFVAIMIIGLILSSAAAIACQEFSVKPNELEKEKPYIDHSICFTRQAYDLDTIDEVFYEGTAKLNSSVLDSPTIKNIRILDYRPLSITLNQQQALRLYYGMEFADVDRYDIDGEMTEVLVSTRELYQDKLPSKTWINKKLIYTHGNGIIINPVSKVTKEGLPELWVKDIPTQSNKPELNITQSQIYYGEVTNNYVITNSKQREFDYPSGDENIYNIYDGSGGIYLSTTLRKFIIGWRLDPIKIWLSDYITPNSRFHLHRNIDERVSKIAPYLYYDKDPHIFIGEEKLFWMISGMVHTKNYPYSESFGNGNYIKDSVKIIIDAKNGTVEFFVIQNDPIIRTYQKIYPGLFKPLDSMPEEHQKHLKYPEDLFTLQTEKLDIYHMTSTEVFYNKEDKWQIGQEVHGLDKEQKVEAYNIILDLNNDAEFMLTLPLTPYDKQNLVAWFAVYQDPAKYGEKVLYKLSKEHLTYGPMQIESRISQDEEISAQMTLWNAGGSSVIRGNLLIIPISGSLLCVEPIYIVSSTKGSMPELKKIVAIYYDPVSDESKLAWDDSLEGAILKVIGESDERIEVVKETIGGQEEIMMLIIYDRNDQEITRISIMENQSISLVSI